ncbi:MAG: hypothetical protein ABI560_11220, partial [Myxococcales bacterium]
MPVSALPPILFLGVRLPDADMNALAFLSLRSRQYVFHALHRILQPHFKEMTAQTQAAIGLPQASCPSMNTAP